jgi:O-antigen/teichoic acid export membrane protein
VTTLGDERPAVPVPGQFRASGRGLARGSLLIAVGLGATGTATLAMLFIVDHKLAATSAGAFNLWWVITTLLITPFGVFEAYLARLIVAEQAAGREPRPVIATLLGRTWMVAAGISVAALCAGPWLTRYEFGGDAGLTWLLPLWVMVTASQAAQRGVATGKAKFPAIAVQLTVDGLLRVGITAAIAFSGHATADRLALGTCIAAAGGLVAGGLMCPAWLVRPTLRATGVSWGPVVLLLGGSVCPVLAGYAPAPWLKAAGHANPTTIIAFTAAVTLSRIPTQFVSAAFGPLLSHLTHAAETGDLATYHRLRRLADQAAAGLGAGFVLVFAVLGVWLLPRFTHTPKGYQLSIGMLAVLALASALMFVAVVQQAGMAATARWGAIAGAWGIGLVALVVIFVLPVSALWRAAAAPAVAIAAALVAMAYGSWRAEAGGRIAAQPV